jgi:enamine deaminase RidA (YjgF/YER057c/UK114 family)
MPEYEIRKIYPSGVGSAPSSGFVPAVVCDDFVFVAGQMAHNPGQGLDARAHVRDHSAWAGSEIRKQTEFLILEKLRPALEAAGSSLEQSLKAQIYLARVDDFPDFVDVWNQYYANIPCAVTLVPDQIIRDGGRHNRDQSGGVDQHGGPSEAGDRCGHSRHGCLWAVHQGRRIPVAFGADGDRARRGSRWQNRLARVCLSFTCRIHPGGCGLRIRRGAVPSCCDFNGQCASRPIFRLRLSGVSRHRDGVVG